VFEVVKGRRERIAREAAAAETPLEATQQFDVRGEDMDATQRIDRIR
jgi:hypothetical protein